MKYTAKTTVRRQSGLGGIIEIDVGEQVNIIDETDTKYIIKSTGRYGMPQHELLPLSIDKQIFDESFYQTNRPKLTAHEVAVITDRFFRCYETTRTYDHHMHMLIIDLMSENWQAWQNVREQWVEKLDIENMVFASDLPYPVWFTTQLILAEYVFLIHEYVDERIENAIVAELQTRLHRS